MRTKIPLFTVTASDCEWSYFRGSGHGGQKKNKTSSACRCVHKASGAVGESSESRSQFQNRQSAFKRMGLSVAFRRWVQEKIAEIDRGKSIEKYVDEQMRPDNLQFEIKKDGKWVVTSEDKINGEKN